MGTIAPEHWVGGEDRANQNARRVNTIANLALPSWGGAGSSEAANYVVSIPAVVFGEGAPTGLDSNRNATQMRGDVDGRRQSVFPSPVFPYIDRPNFADFSHAPVPRLTLMPERAWYTRIA